MKNSRGQWAGPGIKFQQMIPSHWLLPYNMQGSTQLNGMSPWQPRDYVKAKNSLFIHDIAWMIVQENNDFTYIRQKDIEFMADFFHSRLERVSLNRVEIVKEAMQQILKDARSWKITAFHVNPTEAVHAYLEAKWEKLIKREELYLEKEGLE